MSTIMNQVTYSLCNMKTDEIKWKEHLVSTNHLHICKHTKNKLAIKFIERISNASPKKSKIFIFRVEKTHDFRQLPFSSKVSKEKVNLLCSESIDKSESEGSLSYDFPVFSTKCYTQYCRKFL